jgi:predicted transcriptional regulator
MSILDKKKEDIVQITCMVSDDTEAKIMRVRKERGRQTRWIIMSAIREFLKGNIEV